jgi:spore germination protein
MEKLDNLTLEENRSANEKRENDGHKLPPKREADAVGIDPMKAVELCKDYFIDYNIGEYNCVGETVTKGYSAYNIQGYDNAGTMLFAEVSQKDGTLLRFDYYEDCMEETFDRPNAERIADEFLEKLGYEDLEVARAMDNGSTTDFTYVYENEDVLYYPDEIHVKVCRTRGTVSGFDATAYMQNHRGRVEMNPKISMQVAADQLHEGLIMEASTLCVIDTARGERLAYEFLCDYDNQTYFVYIDAENGKEIAIFNTKNLHR